MTQRVLINCTAVCPYCIARRAVAETARHRRDRERSRRSLEPGSARDGWSRSSAGAPFHRSSATPTSAGSATFIAALDRAGRLVPLLNG